MLANHKKRNFSIEKTTLGRKPTTGKAAFQSDFKFKVADTLIFFTYVQFTFMLHYIIHGFLLQNYQFVRQTLQSYNFNLKEQQ